MLLFWNATMFPFFAQSSHHSAVHRTFAACAHATAALCASRWCKPLCEIASAPIPLCAPFTMERVGVTKGS